MQTMKMDLIQSYKECFYVSPLDPRWQSRNADDYD